MTMFHQRRNWVVISCCPYKDMEQWQGRKLPCAGLQFRYVGRHPTLESVCKQLEASHRSKTRSCQRHSLSYSISMKSHLSSHLSIYKISLLIDIHLTMKPNNSSRNCPRFNFSIVPDCWIIKVTKDVIFLAFPISTSSWHAIQNI